MKQRTARSWRRGQQNPVEEITLDAVYSNPTDSTDRTLDQIRQYFQAMSSELFSRMIHDAQSVALGKEWFEMEFQHASFWNIEQEVAELALSPYLANSEPPKSSREAA